MSYYNPEVYNEDNLKEQDKREIQFWRESFYNEIDNALDYVCEFESNTILDKLKREIIEEYTECLKEHLEARFLEVIVSIIDGYGGEEE